MKIKKRIGLFFLVSLFILCVSGHTIGESSSEFVVKKKKKSGSRSKLQEELCEVFSEQLSAAPNLHIKTAKIQDISIKQTRQYLESSKTSFIAKAKKGEIDEAIQKAREFENKMNAFCHECDQYLEYLDNLRAYPKIN